MANQDRTNALWALFGDKYEEYCIGSYGRHATESLLVLPEGVDPLPDSAIKAREYLADLESLTDAELALRHSQLKEQKAAEIEAKHPLNHPNCFLKSDGIDFFARAAYWKSEEAAALLLGRDPNHLNDKKIKEFRSSSRIGNEFQNLTILLNRAYTVRQIFSPDRPEKYIRWAKRFKISVPAELEERLVEFGHDLSDPVDQEEQTPVEATDRKPEAGPSLSQRERTSLLKLVIGMAIRGYGFDPKSSRSGTAAEIAGDLHTSGLSLDADTVRKYLNEAKELLPGDITE